MNGWGITCRFIGEGKSIIAVITQDVYDRYNQTDETFEVCFHDIGLFLDEKYSDFECVKSIGQDIKHILYDFLKKTSSFGRMVDTGLTYAAFTFFRNNDWTYDSPNYRYRFLGAYKDEHSDHKLWAGNKYFCRSDYHASSYVHRFISGELSNTYRDGFDIITGNLELLLTDPSNTHERSIETRAMIDVPEKAASLMSRLKKALPVPTTISSHLAKTLSEKSPGTAIPSRCDIIDVVYTGDAGGILCCLNLGGGEQHMVSITLLSFNRNHSLSREIDVYQRHRIKKMKQHSTYH